MLRSALVGLAAIFCLPPIAAAQGTTACDSAIARTQALSHPAAVSSGWSPWSMMILPGCGDGGVRAFIGLLTSPAVIAESDADRLYVLFKVFDDRQNRALLDAYTAAVVGGTGSEAYRIAAMRALVGAVENRIEIQLPPLSSGKQHCGTMSRRHDEWNVQDRPSGASDLPGDAYARVTATVASVGAGSTGSERTKLAARCWQDLLERNSPIDIRKVSVTYVCATKFQVRNDNPAGVDLRYVLGQKADSGEFGIGGRSVFILDVDGMDTIRVYLDQVLVATRANGHKACP